MKKVIGFILLAFILFSCSGTEVTIYGKVWEEDPAPPFTSWETDSWFDYQNSSAATVRTGNIEVQTASDGTFEITGGFDGGEALLEIEKAGFETKYVSVTWDDLEDEVGLVQAVAPVDSVVFTNGNAVTLFWDTGKTWGGSKAHALEETPGWVGVILPYTGGNFVSRFKNAE